MHKRQTYVLHWVDTRWGKYLFLDYLKLWKTNDFMPENVCNTCQCNLFVTDLFIIRQQFFQNFQLLSNICIFSYIQDEVNIEPCPHLRAVSIFWPLLN